MPNMLEQKINENEELYNSTKKELEDRIGVANGEYGDLFKDFNSQIGYIQNNSMLSKEGKIKQANEIRDSFINKVNLKSLDQYGLIQKVLNIALLEDEKRKLENYKGLNSDMMPQLMYVNAMLNSISSLNDGDLLEDVFNYASEEGNFSDELINMIYIKARNLVNNAIKLEKSENDNENVLASMESAKNRTKVNHIISKINNYKTNYTNEFTNLKAAFTRAVNQKKYPSSLYIQRDPKDDFRLPEKLNNNVWNDSNKSNNPWNR